MFLETQVRQLKRKLKREKKENEELQEELETTKAMLAQWVHIYVASYFYSLSSFLLYALHALKLGELRAREEEAVGGQ